MANPDVQSCVNCRFFRPTCDCCGGQPGVCRRHPPTREGLPMTTGDEWCGEWQATNDNAAVHNQMPPRVVEAGRLEPVHGRVGGRILCGSPSTEAKDLIATTHQSEVTCEACHDVLAGRPRKET